MDLSYSTDIEKAKKLATIAHEGQVDKAGEPYIRHPERIASWLSRPESIVVAWLHDVVEDTGITINTICEAFGYETAEAVSALTHRKGEAWADYLTRVKANEIATEVKVGDLIDNSNLSRLKEVSAKDVMRQAKYNRALIYLMNVEGE